jgi:hypothetical protein
MASSQNLDTITPVQAGVTTTTGRSSRHQLQQSVNSLAELSRAARQANVVRERFADHQARAADSASAASDSTDSQQNRQYSPHDRFMQYAETIVKRWVDQDPLITRQWHRSLPKGRATRFTPSTKKGKGTQFARRKPRRHNNSCSSCRLQARQCITCRFRTRAAPAVRTEKQFYDLSLIHQEVCKIPVDNGGIQPGIPLPAALYCQQVNYDSKAYDRHIRRLIRNSQKGQRLSPEDMKLLNAHRQRQLDNAETVDASTLHHRNGKVVRRNVEQQIRSDQTVRTNPDGSREIVDKPKVPAAEDFPKLTAFFPLPSRPQGSWSGGLSSEITTPKDDPETLHAEQQRAAYESFLRSERAKASVMAVANHAGAAVDIDDLLAELEDMEADIEAHTDDDVTYEIGRDQQGKATVKAYVGEISQMMEADHVPKRKLTSQRALTPEPVEEAPAAVQQQPVDPFDDGGWSDPEDLEAWDGEEDQWFDSHGKPLP